MSFGTINIYYSKTSIFWTKNKGLIFVTDLLNQSGDLYNHSEFISNSRLNVSSSEYRKLMNCISPKLLHLIKTENMYTSVTVLFQSYRSFLSRIKHLITFYIRNIVTRENCIFPKTIVETDISSLILQNPWSDMNKYVISDKLKETISK